MQNSAFASVNRSMPNALQSLLAAVEQGIGHMETTNYPPFNIVSTGEDTFVIQIAVAGFSSEEVDISIEKNILKVVGTKVPVEDDERTFLHRGIAERNFTRSYRLGEYVCVEGAEIKDGILTISLERKIPDEAKPRKVDIRAAQ